MRNSFPPTLKIKKSKEFKRVQEAGNKLFSRHFLIIADRSVTDSSRIGITITTKVDKRATMRNRLKRRIREVFRLNQQHFTKKIDLVVIARRDATLLAYEEIQRQLLGLLRRAGYLKPDKTKNRRTEIAAAKK